MSKQIKNEYLVEKRNVLNEIMWKDRMTLQALRFLSIYLARINARDISTRKVKFSVKEYMDIMGYKGVFCKKHYESTVERLFSRAIHRTLESGGIESFPLFKKLRLDVDSSGLWFVELDASDDALELMFDFKDRYFSYHLWNVLQLTSVNHLRMYEVLKQYEKLKERTLTLDELKLLLGLDTNAYPQWRDFKRGVIETAQKSLAKKTDLCFTYETIRKGRGGKVTGIKMFINKNNSYDRQLAFDEFMGGQGQLTLDYFEEAESKKIIVSPPRHTAIKEKKPNRTLRNQSLTPFDEICEKQFTEKEMQSLYDLLHNPSVCSDKTPEHQHILRKNYLEKAYNELLWREDGASKGVCEKINNRFAYLKGILENKLSERSLEK